MDTSHENEQDIRFIYNIWISNLETKLKKKKEVVAFCRANLSYDIGTFPWNENKQTICANKGFDATILWHVFCWV